MYKYLEAFVPNETEIGSSVVVQLKNVSWIVGDKKSDKLIKSVSAIEFPASRRYRG
jgi:hypothetical protein